MYMTWQVITCSVNALIIYFLAKDVEGGEGDRILYIVYSIGINLIHCLIFLRRVCCLC